MPAIAALIRRLMSLDTNTTGAPGSASLSARIAPRMALSGTTAPKRFPASKLSVWKRSSPTLRAPRNCSPPGLSRRRPEAILSVPCASISSLMKRLTWRALRLASDVPFLPLSSSSITCIGRNTSCSSNLNSAVGSCISTLVSSTWMRLPFVIAWSRRRPGLRPRRWSGLRRGRSPGLRLRFLQCIEHRLRVAGNPDLAPGLRDAALRVDQEGAALDAHDLAPVHVLLVDHVEGAAQRLVGVADQVEAEALLRAEVLVRPDRVARHAQHGRAELAELGQQRVEVDAFGGASGGGVLRVEVQHQPLAAAVAERVVAEFRGFAAGQRQWKLCRDLVAGIDRVGVGHQNFIGSMIASRFRWSQNSRKSSRSAAMCMSAGTPMVTCAENMSAPGDRQRHSLNSSN